LFAPAVTLPKLAFDGMPLGLPQEDAKMTTMARWADGVVAPLAR